MSTDFMSALIGNWIGWGVIILPNKEDVEYDEELTFSKHETKPILRYSQRTWKRGTDKKIPLHEGVGYMKFHRPDGKVEFLVAEANGITEIYEGDYSEGSEKSLNLKLQSLSRTATVKPPNVLDAQMKYTLKNNNDTLSYLFEMATTTNKNMFLHLKATLKKL